MKTFALAADVRRIFAHVSPRRRRQMALMLLLMLAGAVAELVSIGALLPFLTLLADPDRVMAFEPVRALTEQLGLDTRFKVTAAAAGLFAVAALGAAGVRLLLAWANQRFVFGLAQELNVSVYRRTLHQPYIHHTTSNTSDTLASLQKVQQVASGLLGPLMQATSAAVIAVFIVTALVLIDTAVALTAGAVIAGLYVVVMGSARAAMRRNGVIIAATQRQRIQAAREGLGGIRDVLLDRSQPVFVDRFATFERSQKRAQATNQFLAAAPRFIVEAGGMVLIAIVALVLSARSGGLTAALPVLGAMAMGAQRLLPLLQQVFVGWSGYLTYNQSLRDVLDTLELPEAPQFAASADVEPLAFNDTIELRDVSYAYPASDGPAVRGVDLTIRAGARVGFVGKTGSGKSTLMDIVLGLLTPDTGKMLIDGVELTDANRLAWQRRIAHVPQHIYLSDASVAENIAFGAAPDTIDHDRLRRAAEQAELIEVIEALPDGFDTPVGERGIRLSGGQRQRIGIARALYKQATVLVFDEATSALDNETERAVMRSIERLDRSLTILLISHRLSTLRNCEVIVTLDKGTATPRPGRADRETSE